MMGAETCINSAEQVMVYGLMVNEQNRGKITLRSIRPQLVNELMR